MRELFDTIKLVTRVDNYRDDRPVFKAEDGIVCHLDNNDDISIVSNNIAIGEQAIAIVNKNMPTYCFIRLTTNSYFISDLVKTISDMKFGDLLSMNTDLRWILNTISNNDMYLWEDTFPPKLPNLLEIDKYFDTHSINTVEADWICSSLETIQYTYDKFRQLKTKIEANKEIKLIPSEEATMVDSNSLDLLKDKAADLKATLHEDSEFNLGLAMEIHTLERTIIDQEVQLKIHTTLTSVMVLDLKYVCIYDDDTACDITLGSNNVLVVVTGSNHKLTYSPTRSSNTLDLRLLISVKELRTIWSKK